MKLITSLTAMTSILCISFSALSQEEWYIGISGHSSKLDYDGDSPSILTVSSGKKSLDDKGQGINLLIGRHLEPWLALELNASYSNSKLVDYQNYYDFGALVRGYEYAMLDAKIYSFGASTKFIYESPFNLRIYAKPGIGYTTTKIDYDGGSSTPYVKKEYNAKNNHIHFNLEVGTEYFFTNTFAINVAYERRFKAVDLSSENNGVNKFSQDIIKAGILYYF